MAGGHGLEIFDLQFRRESIGWVLRVVIDRPDAPACEPPGREPVGIEDCQRVSHDLERAARRRRDDLRSGGAGAGYTLEVSSPGLDRPLRGEADYRRFTGRLAKVVTAEPVGGQSHFAGRLTASKRARSLLDEGRRVHRVPLARIKRARLDVEF